MTIQDIIQDLQTLGADPAVVNPLIQRIQTEGWTESVQAEVLGFLEDLEMEDTIAVAALESALQNAETNKAELDQIDQQAESSLAQMETELDKILAETTTPPPPAAPATLPDQAVAAQPAPLPAAATSTPVVPVSTVQPVVVPPQPSPAQVPVAVASPAAPGAPAPVIPAAAATNPDDWSNLLK